MDAAQPAAPASDRELVLTRIIDAPREKVFRAWTEPALLQQWITPRPWTVARAEDGPAAGRMTALLKMKKLDIAVLKRAYEG